MQNAVINGADAIHRMRQLKLSDAGTFGLVFIAYNRHRPANNGTIIKVENCELRTSMRSEGLEINADHYLFFTDTDTKRPLRCWKKLIRKVRFGAFWMDVNWFI